MAFFLEIEKSIIKFIWNFKETPSAKIVFKRKKQLDTVLRKYFLMRATLKQ